MHYHQKKVNKHETESGVTDGLLELQTDYLAPVENTHTTQLRAYQNLMDSGTPIQRRENRTGLPDTLKSGIEHLSSYSMDDVQVHYNSPKPAQLQAHAYAQGNQIHLGPGQERHLPHEAWHVVQQKQGRVQPTRQFKGITAINDDKALEHEADVMGARAISVNPAEYAGLKQNNPISAVNQPVQRTIIGESGENLWATEIASKLFREKDRDLVNYISRLHSVQDLIQVKSYEDLVERVKSGEFRILYEKSVSESPDEVKYDSGRSTGGRLLEVKEKEVKEKEVKEKEVKEKGGDDIDDGPVFIRFANLNTAKEKYVSKANGIIAVLNATPEIRKFLRNKNTLITLEKDDNLASVRIVGDQVQISLSPWFFEQQSRGRILGMLAHEFGVHPLADEAMSQDEKDQEKRDVDQPLATGVDGHSITARKAGQKDHVFAAVISKPRFIIYRQTVYNMVSEMLKQTKISGSGITEEHVSDAIMTYLSDIAMILATNDHRRDIYSKHELTAECFNIVRDYWLEFLEFFGGKPNAKDLVRLTPRLKSGSDVRSEVRGIIGSIALSVFTDSVSDVNTTQGQVSGRLAQITPIQQEMLQIYGLNLVPLKEPTDFFQALDIYFQPEATRTEISKALASVVAEDDKLNQSSKQVMTETKIALDQGKLTMPLKQVTLNAISYAYRIRIRIIAPGGKINLIDFRGGPMITLLYVEKPIPHYRLAIR